jgi:hypothetical protein
LAELLAAALFAKQWLVNAAEKDQTTASLRDLGVWLCDRIESDEPELTAFEQNSFDLPPLNNFVTMSRDDLLNIAQSISTSDYPAEIISNSERESWARFMGGVALSYARSGDVAVVAALVRAAAHLDLKEQWLNNALDYVLDQQQPDGSFGLLAMEVALLGQAQLAHKAMMRLTVEVLWAIAEVSAQRRRC